MLHAARWKCRTQKIAKNLHLRTIAQICRAVSSQLRMYQPAERSFKTAICPLHVSAIWRTSAH